MSRLLVLIGLMLLLCWWLNRAWKRTRGSATAGQRRSPQPPPTRRFQRGDERLELLLDDPKRHWVAWAYALLGPLSWPLLAGRYGGVRAAGWAAVAWVLHIGGLRLLLDGLQEPLYWLWLPLPPLLYLAMGRWLVRADLDWRTRALQQRGWRCLDVPAA